MKLGIRAAVIAVGTGNRAAEHRLRIRRRIFHLLLVPFGAERRGRELPPNPAFSDFIAHELMPWLQQQGITSTSKHPLIAGSGYGGLASAWVAMRYAHVFGNVLSLSGSYPRH